MDDKPEQSKSKENLSSYHSDQQGVDNRAFSSVSLNGADKSGEKNGEVAQEAMGLEGLCYRTLCECEESGKTCSCPTKSSPKKPTVQLESWGMWKCKALYLLVFVIVCWIVIFTALIVTNIL